MSGDVLSDLLRAVRLRGEAAFSRAFKRIVGATPGEWRREHQPLPAVRVGLAQTKRLK